MTNIGFIRHRIALKIGGTEGVTVVLRWKDRTGFTLDTSTGAKVGGTVTDREGVLKCQVLHDLSRTSLRNYQELQEGDIALDLPPDTDLSGKGELKFEVAGQTYEQRKLPRQIEASLDVIYADVKLGSLLVLKRCV